MIQKKSALANGTMLDRLPRLNPRQREAVEYCAGPLLVIAGPGTGKTRVLTEKVSFLITHHGYAPESILALTFTEKAAGEMTDRIRARLAEAGVRGQPVIGTFHSFGYALVQEFADRLGFRGPLRLLVGPLYVQFIAEHVDQLVTDHTNLVERTVRFAKLLADFISRCHDENLIGQDLVARVEAWIEQQHPRDQAAAREVRDLAASVPKLLDLQYAQNVVTYGDLLTLACRLLREHPDIRRKVQARFRYVLVDELQDNNAVQFQLVNDLAEPHQRVLVVGDEDQCIYRFRGASLGLIEKFRRHWEAQRGEPVKVIALEENYRSTPAILDACQALIRHNRRSIPAKTLRVADGRTPAGPEVVTLARLETEEQERRFLVRMILDRLERSARRPGDIALLCRSLSHIGLLVADLRRAGVAVEVVGEGGLFSNLIVRELIAWLKALDHPGANEVAFHRVLRLQSFGLTHADQRALGRAAQAEHVPAVELVERLAADPQAAIPGVSPAGLKRLRAFARVYALFRAESAAQTRPDLTGLIHELLAFTGLGPRLRPDSPQGRRDLAAVNGLLQATQAYQDYYPRPHLHGFVQYLDLLDEVGHDETAGSPSEDADTVKAMTVHQAKGREFPVVFISGLSDRFPALNRREWPRKFLDHLTLAGEDIDQVHLEEERRVLYVALSRAQEELVLSMYDKRGAQALTRISPFPDELQESPRVRVERVLPEAVPAVAPAANDLLTRQAAEARLHYLVSRLGVAVHGEEVTEVLREALQLFAGLLAERADPAAVRTALLELARTQQLTLPYAEPDAPAGVSGPLTLSPTALHFYHECPRQYYYKYVVGIPEAVSFEARLGTAIHRALEAYHRKHTHADPAHLPELTELFAAELARVPFQSQKEAEQAQERGRQFLAQYLREEGPRSLAIRKVEVEKPFALRLAPDVTLAGKIDRLDELTDGRFRVVDYKTGRLDSRPEYLAGMQMPIYAWAVREALGRELEAVEVIGLKELSQTAKGARVHRQVLPWDDDTRYALTPARLDQLKAEILAIVEGIRAGQFDPAPDERRCAWCPYRLLCDQAWGTSE